MKIFLNWKQNGNYILILNFLNKLLLSDKSETVLFLPSVYLSFANSGKIMLGGQNVSPFENGAFTGEIAAHMLKEVGAKFCLVGHSERRKYFKEEAKDLKLKLKALKNASITPVLCIGEELFERNNKTFFNKLAKQMEIYEEGVIIAYEPIWAIGSGLTPTIAEISEVANFFYKNYNISILYGGSVSEKNIKEITSIIGICGVLVGGASLKVETVNQMISNLL